jgi:ABC-2 type transport system permease protein
LIRETAMKTILLILKKEFRQLRHDRRMLPITLLPPILQLLIFGYAANLDVKNIPTVVCDMDRSAQSRDVLNSFFQSGYFRMVRAAERTADIDRSLDNGDAALALVVPRGFADDLAAGRQAVLQILVDGTESQTAAIGINAATMILAKRSRTILLERWERAAPGQKIPVSISAETRLWFNPALRSRNYFIPGVLALILMVTTMMLTSMAIVKEKEVGTLEQLIVTPIRPYQMIVGKLLPFVLIGLINISLILAVAAFWFHIPVRGSVVLLLLLSLVFMLSSLGLGLFISTISRNQQQAMMTAVFLMMPMMLLSGFVFPIENMPAVVRGISYLIPMRYYLVIVRGLFLKNVGASVLWSQTAALLVFGVGILALSVARFKKKVD